MTSATAYATPTAVDNTTPGRRCVNASSGHALEKLAHAIEYLSDEFVHESDMIRLPEGQLQAIELLMSLNRIIYLECPTLPTLSDRCKAFVRRCLA
ncbi:MAG TPA: hypothetical protein VKB38_19175 [Terracidiphilus sp.]|nr:hypothetical protein [Terracidiphilus sp.]